MGPHRRVEGLGLHPVRQRQTIPGAGGGGLRMEPEIVVALLALLGTPGGS